MKLWVLGSGSAGNAVLVECGGARVLIDAGFAPRTLAMRLGTIGVAPASIEACIVTHEHHDHVRGAAASAARWGWSLYASTGTVEACGALRDAGCTRVVPGDTITLSGMTVITGATPHDAASPIGVRITAERTGVTAVVCTDVGHASAHVRALCHEADLLVLESNHDDELLRSGPYPPPVAARIASRLGHLSNRESAALARDVVHHDLAHVVLAHLSERCNDRGIAYSQMAETLRRTRFRGGISVAMQHGVIGPIRPKAGRASAGAQFALAL